MTMWRNIFLLVSFFLVEITGQALEQSCGAPRDYPQVQLRVNSRKEVYYTGDRAFYDCPFGHTAKGGSRSVECKNGVWTKLTLRCERNPCGSAGEILNGHFEYEGDALFGDRAVAACDDGYQLKGTGYLECGNLGWKGEIPTCVIMTEGPVEITCPSPTVRNGFRKDGDASVYRPNDLVTFACMEGFSITGSEEVVCGPDGQWNPQLPECLASKEVTCPSPSVANGVRVNADVAVYMVNDSVTFACREGFVLTGSKRVVCGPDGQWNTQLPQCLHSNGSCGAPTVYPNMHPVGQHVSQPLFEPGSRLAYRCAVGYVRSRGNVFISRCVNGRWTEINMRCERKLCGSAGEILHGNYKYEGVMFGDRATAVCNEGFQLVGSNYRECRETGWDGRDPVCEAVQCPDPPEVTDGQWTGPWNGHFLYMTVVSYKCIRGQLVGEQDIFCTRNGTWSSAPPQCKDISCPTPAVRNSDKTSGFVVVYRYMDTVSFACHRGYKMIGDRSVTCNVEGRWSPALPECKSEHGDCGPPPVYPNMKHGRAGSTLDAIKYRCDPGYILPSSGTFISQCINGAWSHITARCQRGYCPSPKVLNSNVTSMHRKKYMYGDVVVLKCYNGYQMTGPSNIQCNAKLKWHPSLPKCTPVRCPAIQVKNKNPKPIAFGRNVDVMCKEGETHRVSCTANGTWVPPIPRCERVSYVIERLKTP